MQLTRTFGAVCQTAVATASLVAYLAVDVFDEWLSNPLVAYSILLAFGVAQLTSCPEAPFATRMRPVRRRFSVLDLLICMGICGVVTAYSRASVVHDGWFFDFGGIAIVICVAVWVHLRFGLTPALAGIAFFAVALLIGFSYELFFYQGFNEVHASDPDFFRRPVLAYATSGLIEGAQFAIVSSTLYFVVTSFLVILIRAARCKVDLDHDDSCGAR